MPERISAKVTAVDIGSWTIALPINQTTAAMKMATGHKGRSAAVKKNRTQARGRRLGFRIAGAEHLTKGIGFAPYAFHEGLVFHGVLARGLKLSPQAMDDRQTLATVRYSGAVSQAGSVRSNCQVEQ